MRIEDFFKGRLEGWGAVIARGRVVRRVSIAMTGEWRERERALHLRETYDYGGGDTLERVWTVHVDPDGVVQGRDQTGLARLSGRETGEQDVRLRFDGPRGPNGGRFSPPVQLDFIQAGGGVILAGRAGWGPLILGRLHGALHRLS